MTVSTGPPEHADNPSIVRFRLCVPASGIVLLLVGILLWHSDRTIYFRGLHLWGVPALPRPFADWDAVVHIMQCARRGANVYVRNQCGTFMYTPLWGWARLIPRAPAWIDGIGLAIDAAFFASLWFAVRPRSWPDTVVVVLASLSTASIYAIERANVDLIVFVLLMAAAALVPRGPFRRIAGYLLILLAGLLKFYPFAAFAIAMRERTPRLLAVALVAIAALAALLLYMRTELAPLAANLPGGRYGSDAFGATNLVFLLKAAGNSQPISILALAILSLCAMAAALSLARDGGFVLAFSAMDENDRTALVLASAVIVACFLASQNILYRAILLVPVVGGLCALRGAAAGPGLRVRLAVLIGTSLVVMWEGALQGVFPGHRIPAPYLLAREALWWWVVTNLAAVLIVFAATSDALALVCPLLPSWMAPKAEERTS